MHQARGGLEFSDPDLLQCSVVRRPIPKPLETNIFFLKMQVQHGTEYE